MIEFLKNLKLSITQWLGVTAAAVIGFLVLALKLQGSKLHKAKVDLLKERLDRKIDEKTKKVRAARKKFQDAMDDYLEHK